jgi:hypothetical protein
LTGELLQKSTPEFFLADVALLKSKEGRGTISSFETNKEKLNIARKGDRFALGCFLIASVKEFSIPFILES